MTHQDSSFEITLLDCTSSFAGILCRSEGLRGTAAGHMGIPLRASGLPVAWSSRLLFKFIALSVCFG